MTHITTRLAALEAALVKAQAATSALLAECHEAIRQAEVPAEVLGLLAELLAAEDDSAEHFARYVELVPGPAASPKRLAWDDQSPESRADWHRCCVRRDAAIDALVAYAQTRASIDTDPAAATRAPWPTRME